MEKPHVFESLNPQLERIMLTKPCVVIDLTKPAGSKTHFETEMGSKLDRASDLLVVKGIHDIGVGVIVGRIKRRVNRNPDSHIFIYGFHKGIYALSRSLRKYKLSHGVVVSQQQLKEFGKLKNLGREVTAKELADVLKEDL